jgi:ribosome recycling factor
MTCFMLEDPNRLFSDVAVADPRSAITEALLGLTSLIEGSKVRVDMNSEIQEAFKEDTKQLVDSLVEKHGIEVETRTHYLELDGHS